MAEYNLADLFEDVVIKIDGHPFKLKMRTASVTDRVEVSQKKLTELEGRDPEPSEAEFAEVLVEIVDAMLEPVNTNGTRSHAKTILSRALKNETLGPDEILALSEFIRQKMEDRRRPPSAAPSDG